jgi:transposase
VIVISGHARRTKPLAIAAEKYKGRHLVENFSATQKVKRIAMRSDKTNTSFSAMIQLAAAVMNSQ